MNYRGWILIAMVLVAGSVEAQLPDGWYMSANDQTLEPGSPRDYNIGLDKSNRYNGKLSAFIESRASVPEGLALLVQEASPVDYKGKRVRISAYVNSDDVDNWGGLFLQVEGKSYGPKADSRISYDFMYDRPVKGDTEWKKRELVLNIPNESERILFGFWLQGKGKIWADDFLIEIVGDETPVTGSKRPIKRPRNLNLED